MKCLILTDTHLGVRRSNRVFEEHILRLHEKAVQYCIDNDIKHILHAGDCFDVRGTVNVQTLKAYKSRFVDFAASNDIFIDMVPGNHDCALKNTIVPNTPSEVLRDCKNVAVHNTPTVLVFEDNTSVCLVPWLAKDEESSFMSLIESASLKSNICIGHFEFAGFLFQRGVFAKDGTDSSTFSKLFELVLSGHYHTKSSQGNVHYLGTAYDLNWGDYNEKKFFHVLDTATLELTAIENGERLFHSLIYDDRILKEEDLTDIPDELGLQGRVIRVSVKHKKNGILYDAFMDALNNTNPHDIVIVDETTLKDATVEELDISILTKTTQDVIVQVVDDMELDPEEYSKDRVKALMQKYEEAALHD